MTQLFRQTLLAFLLLETLGAAQNKAHIEQNSSKSSCSNILALSGNVDIKCTSLTPEQAKLLSSIPSILKKILSQQPDPDILIKKLDAVLAASRTPDMQTCIGSNCFQGQNYGSISQNQYGPPALTLSPTQAAQVTQTMSSFRGTRIDISLANKTEQSELFTYNLCRALRNAGVDAALISDLTISSLGRPPLGMSGDNQLPSGIVVDVGVDAEPVANALVQILFKSGVLIFRPVRNRDSTNPMKFQITIFPGIGEVKLR